MTLKELESKVVSLANSPDYHKTYVFMDEDAADEWTDAYLSKRTSEADPIFVIYGGTNIESYLQDNWVEATVETIIPVDRNMLAVVLDFE